MDAPEGSIIVFAAQAGKTASDGTGTNGLFTSKLLNVLDEQNINITDVFKKVKQQVYAASGEKQLPSVEDNSIGGDFYFTTVKKIPEANLATNYDRSGETENKTSSLLKSDNSNSTTATPDLVQVMMPAIEAKKTEYKANYAAKGGKKASETNTSSLLNKTAIPVTSILNEKADILNEKAEYHKAKIDYEAGTISKDDYKTATKKYSTYASYISVRLQNAFRNKEITRAEYSQAIKILLRK